MSGKRSATSSLEQDSSILFDGWPLVYAPASPAALHLLELIQALPVDCSACLALPGALDDATAGVLRAVPAAVSSTPNTPSGLMNWEQRALPATARQVRPRVLHTTSLYPPLASPVPVVVSPVETFSHRRGRTGLVERLRVSLGQGGLSRVNAVLWPADIPAPLLPAPVCQIPAHTHGAFLKAQPRLNGLPEAYLLAPNLPDSASLELLAAAWSWASAGLGEDWALLASGLDARALEKLRLLCREAGASGPVEGIVPVSPAEWASLYQHAGAVLQTSPPHPWADPYLHALAAACPLVAEETPLADARIGPAGFLTPPGDARALGAAALTVLVEEAVAAQLSQAAEARVSGWQHETFAARLRAVYDSL